MTKITPQVLIMCLADPSGNPRPSRMIALCNELGFQVDVASYAINKALDIRNHFMFKQPSVKIMHKIIRKLVKIVSVFLPFEAVSEFVNWIRWDVFEIVKKIEKNTYDFIVVHDALLLPLCFKIKNSAKIIFDAREYYPAEIEGNILWQILERPERIRICKSYLRLCDVMMTVSPGLAERYTAEFGVSPQLIMSTPNFYETKPKPTNSQNIRMVHHGGANRDRKLENMIEMFSYLDDRFSLDFYLTGSESYKQQLINLAKGNDRIRFRNPVPFSQIIPMLTDYDIGLYLLEPTGFNTEYALPNKFFEFIQARLMVAIGPSPDMQGLLEKYDCGIVSKDFSPRSMSSLLNGLVVEVIDKKKASSHLAAQDLCFEKEKIKLSGILLSALSALPTQ